EVPRRACPPLGADIGCYFYQDAGCSDLGSLCATSRSDKAIACNCGRQVRSGGQGVAQGADVRASRSDPGFGIYAGLPLACRMASDEIPAWAMISVARTAATMCWQHGTLHAGLGHYPASGLSCSSSKSRC